MPKVLRSKTDAIRSLIEVYELEKALCLELIARRYRVTREQAARDYERVATLLERRRARPVLPPPANVAEARRPGVSAMLPHFYGRVVPALLKPLASRYANLLKPDAEENTLLVLHELANRLWHLRPPAEALTLPFDDPLVKAGVAYLYRAAANRIISEYGRTNRRRRESRLPEDVAFTTRSASARRSPSSDLTPLMSQLWDRFWQLCGDAKARETAKALVESARLFRRGEGVEDQFLFFHAWLDGDRLSGCPEPQWVRAHLQILLGLNDDALNVRKFRLKAVWKAARHDVLYRSRTERPAPSSAVTCSQCPL